MEEGSDSEAEEHSDTAESDQDLEVFMMISNELKQISRHPIPYSLIKIEDKYNENLRTKLLVKVQTNPQTNSCRQICCTNCPKFYIRNVIYFADKLYSQTLWTNFADKLCRQTWQTLCRQILQTNFADNSISQFSHYCLANCDPTLPNSSNIVFNGENI